MNAPIEPTLVDTDIMVDAARGDEAAASFILKLENAGDLWVSAITYMELLVGCRNKREQEQLESLMARVQVVPFSDPISSKSIELLKKYRLNHGLLIADSLLAATSLHLKTPLATMNKRHFRFITDLQLVDYP